MNSTITRTHFPLAQTLAFTIALFVSVAHAQMVDMNPVERTVDEFTSQETCGQNGTYYVTSGLDFLMVTLEVENGDLRMWLGVPYSLLAPQANLYGGQPRRGDQVLFRLLETTVALDVHEAYLAGAYNTELAVVHPTTDFLNVLLNADGDVPIRLTSPNSGLQRDRTIPREMIDHFNDGFAQECEYQ